MGKCWIIKTIFSKIHIHFFFYVVALTCILCGYFYPFLLFMYLIVVHECGHMIAGIFFGWHIKKIVLLPFGGLTIFEDSLNKPIREEMIITIMGPLFQILGYYLLKCKVEESIFFSFHYAILIFNLLPIYPLDGSRLFHLTLQRYFPFYKSYQILIIFSCTLALFLLLLNSLIFKNGFLLITLLLLHKHIYKVYKEYPFYFKKFLLERYLYPLHFKKRTIINEASLKRMKRDYKHLFYVHHKYITERELLHKTFDK